MCGRVLTIFLSVLFVLCVLCPSRVYSNNKTKHYQDAKKVLAQNKDHSIKRTRHNVSRQLQKKDKQKFDAINSEINEKRLNLRIWPKGIIPYFIDIPSFPDKPVRDKIRAFLDNVNIIAGTNFIELPRPPKDKEYQKWVFFINRSSQLVPADNFVLNFTNQGVQRVLLGYDCIASNPEFAALVMAILGIPAQHNAPYRDQYIKVQNDNIIPEKNYLFRKFADEEWIFSSSKYYDSNSVTHFHMHQHTKNGRATLLPKDPSMQLLPSRTFTYHDIQKIKSIYNLAMNYPQNNGQECKKLFKRGKNFGKNNMNSEEKEESSDESGRKNQTVNVGSNKKTNKVNADDTNDVKKPKQKIQRNEKTQQRGTVRYSDPLTYLSDYGSDDNYYQRSIWKKTSQFGKMAGYWERHE